MVDSSLVRCKGAQDSSHFGPQPGAAGEVWPKIERSPTNSSSRGEPVESMAAPSRPLRASTNKQSHAGIDRGYDIRSILHDFADPVHSRDQVDGPEFAAGGGRHLFKPLSDLTVNRGAWTMATTYIVGQNHSRKAILEPEFRSRQMPSIQTYRQTIIGNCGIATRAGISRF